MMKKLMVLMMVLGMASMASAAPTFRVDPQDLKDHYTPSDIITIQLVDNDVKGFAMDAVNDNGGLPQLGTAASPAVASGFTYQQPGTVNYQGMLVAFIGGEELSVPPVPQSGVLWSFEYHVPEVRTSTIISINAFGDDDVWLLPEITYGNGETTSVFAPALVHVIPEPATIVLLGLGGLFLRRRSKKQQTA